MKGEHGHRAGWGMKSGVSGTQGEAPRAVHLGLGGWFTHNRVIQGGGSQSSSIETPGTGDV